MIINTKTIFSLLYNMKKNINFQKLCTYNKVIPYLKKIDSNKKYSNFGPLYNTTIEKIKKYFRVKNFNGILTSSGDASLNAIFKLIKNLYPNKKLVICPSFAFHSDVNNIFNNGLKPYFVDINKNNLTFDYNLLKKIIIKNKKKIAAILFVSPFGYPIPNKNLNIFFKKYKIPIVYDAADTFMNLNYRSLNKNIFIACSFHPTKTFPSNESGLILAPKKYKNFLLNLINHGIIDRNNKYNVYGFNGKASEYDCAIFLANFNQIKENKKKLKKINLFFKLNLNNKFIFQPDYSKWVSNKIIFFTKINVNKIEKVLKKFSINLFKIWRSKCLHQIKQFKNHYKTSMKNSLYYKKMTYCFFIDARFNINFMKNVCKNLNKL